MPSGGNNRGDDGASDAPYIPRSYNGYHDRRTLEGVCVYMANVGIRSS